jgi:hypothetical protein
LWQPSMAQPPPNADGAEAGIGVVERPERPNK